MELRLEPILKEGIEVEGVIFPRYITKGLSVKVSLFWYLYYSFLLFLFNFLIRFRLNITGYLYKKYTKDKINNKEVEHIYEREAKGYEKKHHLTTNFRDTWWRRQTGINVISYVISKKRPGELINILDIATGVGLSVEEMLRIFREFDLRVKISAVDYNESMLWQAENIFKPRMIRDGLIKDGEREIEFNRADARNLTSGELKIFPVNSIDCITIMFGIGGIDDPVSSFREQLIILKEGGILSMIDIHRPIVDLAEKWPFFIPKKSAQAFNLMAWERITKPIVLSTLWGWRDTTILFYILPLICISRDGKYYSFQIRDISLNNEPWWFGLPVMYTMDVVAEKIEISKKEFEERNSIIKNIRV